MTKSPGSEAAGQTGFERRYFTVEGLKVETRADGKRGLSGHAAVFNVLSENLGGFRELIKPGAFTEALKRDDIRALFNHDPNFVLGRNRAGTLRLAEDERGLAIDCDAPATTTIADLVLAPIERGDVSQMSFGFSCMPGGQDWAEDEDGVMIRTITEVKLYDVSPVTFPAYTATDIAVRALDAYRAAHPKPVKTPLNLLRAKEMLARV